MAQCCKTRERFELDVANVISLTEKFGWKFKDFHVEGLIVTFGWCGKYPAEFSLCATDEYPENSLLSYIEENKTEVVNRSVPVILQKLHTDILCKERGPEMDLLCKPTVNRLLSKESDQSEYKDCVSGFDTDEYDDYFDENQFSETDNCDINSLIVSDIEQVELLYGDKSVTHRLLDPIHEIDIELNIPVSFLEEDVTSAWKISRDEPIVVRLHLSSHDYLDYAVPPKIEVYQLSKKDKFSIGIQMAKILEVFILEQWKKISNKTLDNAISRSVSVPTELCNILKDDSALPDTSSLDIKDPVYDVDDSAICQIVDMGFSVELARNSLIITRGNVQEALNFLVTSPESCVDMNSKTTAGPSQKPPPPSRQNSQPNCFKMYNKKLAKRQKSMVTSATTPNLASNAPLEDLTLLPSSTIKGLNSKNIPSLENGFLVQVFRYARQRIPTLNEYCIICDEPHVFQNGAMLKPAVCSRELCVFSYQTLHVMGDAAADIATGAEVVDLLVTMSKAACKSNRRTIIFDPYPTIVHPMKTTELALSPKNKDYSKIEEIMNMIPDMNSMSMFTSLELKTNLDVRNILAYPLLQWIISSNRSHIVKLSPNKIISSMATPHQFLLRSSPPAKEAKFCDLRKQYGSTFAFHGSGLENWHSIIREGLVVASGTSKQVNGSAYGKGIYLSPSSSISFGYSRMGYGVHRTQKGKTVEKKSTRFLNSNIINCIAICEVITSPELKKNNDIWVAANSDHVCTRFFFVYEDGQVGDSNINTQVTKYRNEIDKAMSDLP